MITSLYAGLLGLLFILISIATIKARQTEKVSLGTGDKQQLLYPVSAHNNFASYTPLFLLLLFLLEKESYHVGFLHAAGLVFLVGRILHFLTMRNHERTFKHRKLAMMLTLWPLIVLSVLNIYNCMSSFLFP